MDLPIKNCDFPVCYATVYQRVKWSNEMAIFHGKRLDSQLVFWDLLTESLWWWNPCSIELRHWLCIPVRKWLISPIYTGWWFGTFFIFPYIGNNSPNWLIFFQRGWNHQPVYIYYIVINPYISIYLDLVKMIVQFPSGKFHYSGNLQIFFVYLFGVP